jgi:hypothetical protein
MQLQQQLPYIFNPPPYRPRANDNQIDMEEVVF